MSAICKSFGEIGPTVIVLEISFFKGKTNTHTHQKDFFKSNNPKKTICPSKTSIGGSSNDIYKIDSVASFFVEKVEVYGKIMSSYSFDFVFDFEGL